MLRMRLLGSCATVCGALLAASGLNAQEAAKRTPKGTLTIAAGTDPRTMDPQMHRDRFAQNISHIFRDKLYYQPPPGLKFAPLLAEGFTQTSPTTYELKIREGVLFHNGDELTADDFVYTWNRLADPANKSPRANMVTFKQIESIEAVGKHSVRITTKIDMGPPEEAMRQFGFGSQEILSRKVYEGMSLEEASRAPAIGVGAFKFVEWVPEQRVVMEAFEDYWQGAPGVERIIFRSVPEEATKIAELLAGSVDIISAVGPDSIDMLKSAGMVIEAVPGTAAQMLQMNIREGSPFADPEVRRAMNMAIDKNAIAEHIFGGLALPFEQVAGVGQEGFIEGYDPFPYDPEAARAVLSKITQPIELPTLATYELAAEYVAEQLRGLGMNVTTIVVDTATMISRSDSGDFDLILMTAGYGGGDFLNSTYSNNFGCARLDAKLIRTGFCNPELDAKAEAVTAERDPALRKAKLEEITRELTEVHMPWVPLFGKSEVWAMQPYVKGFIGSPTSQMFDLYKVTLEK